MSTYSESSNRTGRDPVRRPHQPTRHRRDQGKTTEIIFSLLTVAGVLIASALVDENEDG